MKKRLPLTWILIVALAGATRGALPAPANPVTNGDFEELDAKGQPRDWQILGKVEIETTDVHTGKQALRLKRLPNTRGETGLNRDWQSKSGRQGAMLDRLHGGITFWYKAVSAAPDATLTVQVIPMNDKPLEVGGKRVRWQVPNSQIGDGRWHAGKFAYDFRKEEDVKWVHVSARITGSEGELLLDDIAWVEHVGPVLQITRLEISELPGREGERGVLEAKVKNLGDQPAPKTRIAFSLPPGLQLAERNRILPALPPGEETSLSWELRGRRQGGGQHIEMTLDSAAGTSDAVLRLEAALVMTRVEAERLYLPADGSSIPVKVFVRNAGNAFATGPFTRAAIQVPDGIEVTRRETRPAPAPGLEGPAVVWQIRARRPLSWTSIEVTGGADDAETPRRIPVLCVRIPLEKQAAAMPAGSVVAAVRGKTAVVGTDKIRLVLGQNPAGAFARGILQVRRRNQKWDTVARLPKLGLLATPDSEILLAAAKATAKKQEKSATLDLEGKCRTADSDWKIAWRFSAAAGDDCVDVRLTVTPKSPARITACEGPMLYAGEDSAAPRQDAILPGLEWLVQGEQSSNSLDIKPDHPDRLRYVPHPGKITVPAVGLRLDGTAIGLLWPVPAAQPSRAFAGPMSLVFATPDRFEGHRNHLMGLFLPGVGRGLAENHRRADIPLKVQGGFSLTLACSFFAAPSAPDALVVLDRWYARYGFPAPRPYPRGSAQNEIAFSLQAYFDTCELWNPEWKRWYSDLIVGFHPTLRPAIDLLWGCALIDNPKIEQRAMDMVRRALGDNPKIQAEKMRFRTTPQTLRAAERKAIAAMSTQEPDGTWRFHGKYAAKPGEWPPTGANYDYLGPEGASEVGLSARNAMTVLEYAMLTGDKKAEQAGLRALEAMRQFRVPRAAQVWEVPVHTPDILASARAAIAFLDGFRLTGDRQWLEQAVYWARTGLPFVYVWSNPDQPAMQGATIPVFGATHYILSWFGVAVQWNGLAYSQLLFDLAEYDRSFPWKRVAENILRSAMYQQATTGKRLGEWPDALNFIAGRRGPHGQTPPCFQPVTILRQIYRLLGARLDPTTLPLRDAGGRRVALRTVGVCRNAAFQGDTVTFELLRKPPQNGAVELIGVDKPKGVFLAEKPLPERRKLWQQKGPGWTWHPDIAVLEIRPGSTTPARLRVTGVRPRRVTLLPATMRRIDFSFENDPQGWIAAHDLAPLTAADGILSTLATGNDPYMIRNNLMLQGRPSDRLLLRVALEGGPPQMGSVFWGTATSPAFSPDREIHVVLPVDGAFHDVIVPVGKHAEWANQSITNLRFDPGGNHAGTRIRIKAIRLER